MSSADHPILGISQLETACSDIYELLIPAERQVWERYRSDKTNIENLEKRLVLSEWGGDPPVPLYTYVFRHGDYQLNDPDLKQLNVPKNLRHPDAAIAKLEDRIVEYALTRIRTNQLRQRQIEVTRQRLIAEGRDPATLFHHLVDFVEADKEFEAAIETTRLPNGAYPHPDAMARALGLPRAELRKRAKALGLKIRGAGRPKQRKPHK